MSAFSTVKRRPSTLSELFQGTPLKLKKTSPETSGPKTGNGSVNPGGNLSSQKSAQEDVQPMSVVKEELPADVKSMEDSEQTPDVSNSLCVQKSQTLNSEPTIGQSCGTQENGQKVPSISSEEGASGITLSDSEEQTENKSVPQKRAGAVALPLLALFFQQLKSKPKSAKITPKPDDPVFLEKPKSKPKPVNTAPKPDAAGSTWLSKGNTSPSTSIRFIPNSTNPSESCTQLVDTHTSSTLSPVSSNKTVENIVLNAPSECLTSPKTDDIAAMKTFPEIQTLCKPPSPETRKTLLSTTVPSKTDTTPVTNEAKPQSLTVNSSEDLVNQSTTLATPSEAAASDSAPCSPSSLGFSHGSPAPSSDQEPSDPPPNKLDITQASEQAEGNESSGGTGVASLVINSSNQLSVGKKSTGRRKKVRKIKQPDEPLLVGGPTDVRMHPNLEDVEGQLFVSFTSKVTTCSSLKPTQCCI